MSERENIEDEKEGLRGRMRRRLAELDPQWPDEKSGGVRDRVLTCGRIRAAGCLCLYLATDAEVRTDGVIEAAWRAGCIVCVPARDTTDRGYRPAEYRPETALVEGMWGIREPSRPRWVRASEIDAWVLPGLAFDAVGGRLGHGGGFIDRMLADACPDAFMLGVAWDFQVLPQVPMGPRDVRMNAVVTERRFMECNDEHPPAAPAAQETRRQPWR